MWKINELSRINIVRKINKRKGKIYLFLDFDGVINILGNLEDLENEEEYDFCDAKAVKRISDLCLNFDIDIIISSSWRFSGLDFCREYLVQHGLDEKVRVSDVTQSVSLMSREEDILQYLYEHE
ncbi:MAG: hypothetical protein IJ875_01995, partial [Solobacterium sp.]|nr:hypothetical protein [Solobacterium sp.]